MMNIYLEAVEHHLPETILSSLEIENQLKETYDRFNFSFGRLEFFTGIKERLYWQDSSLTPSDVASIAGKKCLEKHNILPEEIDIIIFCSVCRDFLEPASSVFVHRNLGLLPQCKNFDLSNACLGMMSGIEVAQAMIISKQAQRVLLVSGEIGYPLLQKTIKYLQRKDISKKNFKDNFSSLTIGSAASAILVSSEEVLKNKFLKIKHTKTLSDTLSNDLCKGDYTEDKTPLMQTNSQTLLEKGINLAQTCWIQFLKQYKQKFNKIYHHQVGKVHTKTLFKQLTLELKKTYETFPFLGNCGSPSLPITLALAKENKHLKPHDKIALLGIGSGINCTIMGLEW